VKAERIARLVAAALAIGLPLAALAARIGFERRGSPRLVELHGIMAETGGWTPADITVAAGETLRLRLTSDDVVHGFAVGQSDRPAVDVMPGKVTETEVTFDRPGRYTFYCTRWCGLNHWRMRGAIEVVGQAAEEPAPPPPLYLSLDIDIDAPHPAQVVPAVRPSAARGELLDVVLPHPYLTADYYRAHSPAAAWIELRAEAATQGLTDADVWDLAAFVWQSNTTRGALSEGGDLYVANCAACHGEAGQGDGVFAPALEPTAATAGHGLAAPVAFTDAATMLGASPALLQGKILRGGMGTGMPYWGPIFTDAQTWAIVDYLWTFQMEYSP
jgi:mono/diheme cytochrome c family protein/plastocyanin